VSTPQAAQRIAQRHRMLRPRQVAPHADLGITNPSCAPSTSGTDISPPTTPLELKHHRPIGLTDEADHPIVRQPQNPRTIAERSPVLPCCDHIKRRHHKILDSQWDRPTVHERAGSKRRRRPARS
jgi:hypothetical protein